MATRAPSQANQERAIFEAFLAAYPSFAAQVTEFRQPDVEFPDVVFKLLGGAEVDFELGEWLDGQQMAEAKNLPTESARARAGSLRDLSDMRAVHVTAGRPGTTRDAMVSRLAGLDLE